MINTQWHQLELSKSFSNKTGCIEFRALFKINNKRYNQNSPKLSNYQYRFKILKNYKKLLALWFG